MDTLQSYMPEPRNRLTTRGKALVLALGVSVLGVYIASQASSRAKANAVPAPTVACDFSDQTRPFTFGVDNFQSGGFDDAVHLVNGSTSGVNAPCFEATRTVVRTAVGDHVANFGQTIYIPTQVEVVPLDQD